MTALRLERLRRFRLFGESWSGDKLAAFSESTRWSSFPYFTWVLSPALEWSSAHTKKKKKKAAEQKILACDTMLLDLQKKKKSKPVSLTIWPKTKQNTSSSLVLSKPRHGQRDCGIYFFFLREMKWARVSPLVILLSPSVFLTLFRWASALQSGVVFTDQSRSVKSRIIAPLDSPGIPWHIVLVCSLFKHGSLTETGFSKNKLSRGSVPLHIFYLFFPPRQWRENTKKTQNFPQNIHATFGCERCTRTRWNQSLT